MGCNNCDKECDRREPYYQLKVPAGIYTDNNIFGLMWEVLKHRFSHLVKHRRWMD